MTFKNALARLCGVRPFRTTIFAGLTLFSLFNVSCSGGGSASGEAPLVAIPAPDTYKVSTCKDQIADQFYAAVMARDLDPDYSLLLTNEDGETSRIAINPDGTLENPGRIQASPGSLIQIAYTDSDNNIGDGLSVTLPDTCVSAAQLEVVDFFTDTVNHKLYVLGNVRAGETDGVEGQAAIKIIDLISLDPESVVYLHTDAETLSGAHRLDCNPDTQQCVVLFRNNAQNIASVLLDETADGTARDVITNPTATNDQVLFKNGLFFISSIAAAPSASTTVTGALAITTTSLHAVTSAFENVETTALGFPEGIEDEATVLSSNLVPSVDRPLVYLVERVNNVDTTYPVVGYSIRTGNGHVSAPVVFPNTEDGESLVPATIRAIAADDFPNVDIFYLTQESRTPLVQIIATPAVDDGDPSFGNAVEDNDIPEGPKALSILKGACSTLHRFALGYNADRLDRLFSLESLTEDAFTLSSLGTAAIGLSADKIDSFCDADNTARTLTISEDSADIYLN